MLRSRTTAVAVALGAALAVSGCIYDDGAYYGSGPYASGYYASGLYTSGSYDDRYYADYSSYRQAQWDRYGYQRQQMIERERLAVQSERLRLERERLAWERREQERLRRENELRAQWERDKARYDQQHRQQPRPTPAYNNPPNSPRPPSFGAPSPGHQNSGQFGGNHGGSSSGMNTSGTSAWPGVNKPVPKSDASTPAAAAGVVNQPYQKGGKDAYSRPKFKDRSNKSSQDQDSASTSEEVDRDSKDNIKSDPTPYRGRGQHDRRP